MAELQEFTFGQNDDVKWTTDTTTFPQTLNTETAVREMFQTQPDMIQAYLNDQVVPAVNGKLEKSGGTMSSPINMGGNRITNVGAPTADADAATKAYVDDGLSAKQNTLTFDTTPTANSTNPVTSGGVKTALDGKQNALTFDTTPTTDSGNPVTSGGVKTALDAKLSRSGGTMSGAIAMGSNKITGIGTPTEGADAANKGYVDDEISAKQDIFFCTYGTTMYAEITAALAAGKLPVCVMDGVEMVYTKNIGAALDFITGHCFQGVSNSISTAAIYRAVCGTDSEWYSDSVSLATAQDLSDGLADKQNTLTFDSVPTESSDNPVKSGGVYTALAGKQGTLTFDSAPTENSDNPVKSGGVYTALAGKQNTLTFDSSPKSGSNNPVKSSGIKNAIDDSKPIVITRNGMSVAAACTAALKGISQGRSVYVEIETYLSGGVLDTMRLYLTNEVVRTGEQAYYFGSFVEGTLYGIKLLKSSGWGELTEIPLGGA